MYGHVWVVLGLLGAHPAWGVIALPLLARRYVRRKDLGSIAPRHRPAFRTKLAMAVELMPWRRELLAAEIHAVLRPGATAAEIAAAAERLLSLAAYTEEVAESTAECCDVRISGNRPTNVS